MENLKVLVVDDEPEARALVVHYLEASSNRFRIYEAPDGRTAFDIILKERPDILFLDIHMPEMNGMEVLQKLENKKLPVIIFTTAFDEYALPAFEHEAMDYLLKPFEKSRFDKALNRALDYLSLKKPASYIEQLTIKDGTRSSLIETKQIDFIESSKAYLKIHVNNRTYLMRGTLYEIEEILDPGVFKRIHKSAIINMHAINQLRALPGGDFVVILKNGKEIRGSRNFKDKLHHLR